MSKQSEKVIRWRANTKRKVISSMGGCCQICKYNKCDSALDLHHIDPSAKELSFNRIRANPVSSDKIKNELKKCILLCCRCHREVHAGIVSLPETYQTFDEEKYI